MVTSTLLYRNHIGHIFLQNPKTGEWGFPAVEGEEKSLRWFMLEKFGIFMGPITHTQIIKSTPFSAIVYRCDKVKYFGCDFNHPFGFFIMPPNANESVDFIFSMLCEDMVCNT